jgi:DNA-directed RNA polymerase sigma subunit (sigma70/sigma32)
MKTIKQLSDELKLTPEQQSGIEKYCSELAIELLKSIKDDNAENFDETIQSLNSPSTVGNSQ